MIVIILPPPVVSFPAAVPVLRLIFIPAAVTPDAVLKITDAFFPMLRRYSGRRVLMAAVAGVGRKLLAGSVAVSTVGRVVAVEAKILGMVEGGREPGLGAVTLPAVVD